MGKKSRKNRKPAVKSTVTINATNDVGLYTATVADRVLPSVNMTCFHGSTLAKFNDPTFMQAIQAYFDMRGAVKEAMAVIETTYQGNHRNVMDEELKGNLFPPVLLFQKFDSDHKHLIVDTDFCDFVFAYCTHLYLTSWNEHNLMVFRLLTLGFDMRYIKQVGKGVETGIGSQNYDKVAKYNIDIRLERGVINCLARETPCSCMNPKKAEAKEMDKNGTCCGCKNEFLKQTLKACTGCHNTTRYCSRQCQIDNQRKGLTQRITAIIINQLNQK